MQLLIHHLMPCQTTPLNLSVDEAIMNSKKSSSFLTHMIVMIDPQQIKANEIAKVCEKK